MALRLARINENGPDHAWEGRSRTALCGVTPVDLDDRLLPPSGFVCMACQREMVARGADVPT